MIELAEFPALPLFTDAYLADTRHLTAAQHGAYLLLLMMAWRSHDCAIPDDDEKLARWASMDRRTWANNKTTILAFWKLDAGFWRQARLSDERNYVEQKRNINSAAGKFSALKRLNRAATPVQPTVNENTTPTLTPTKKEKDILTDIQKDPDNIHLAFDAFNTVAEAIGLPIAQALTDRRRKAIAARLKDCGGLDGWTVAMAKLKTSPLCRGQNERGWKADLDFVLQQKSFTRLMEGSYDGKPNGTPQNSIAGSFSLVDAAIDDFERRQREEGAGHGPEDPAALS